MSPTDATRERFSFYVARITAGLNLQRRRIMNRDAQALKLYAGTDHEVSDPIGNLGNDLDYYIYELARLRDLACTVSGTFDQPQEIVDALENFDQAVPNLREIRNPLTHPSDDGRLDGVVWLTSWANAYSTDRSSTSSTRAMSTTTPRSG